MRACIRGLGFVRLRGFWRHLGLRVGGLRLFGFEVFGFWYLPLKIVMLQLMVLFGGDEVIGGIHLGSKSRSKMSLYISSSFAIPCP